MALENRCPACGGSNVKNLGRGVVGCFFWPLSLLFMRPRRQCQACGATWRA